LPRTVFSDDLPAIRGRPALIRPHQSEIAIGNQSALPSKVKFPTTNAQIPVGGAINSHPTLTRRGVFNVPCQLGDAEDGQADGDNHSPVW
jgi:hypothetical protein